MGLPVDQLLEENILIDNFVCTSIAYDEYRAIETKQGYAIVGYPKGNARITREQLLDCEEIITMNKYNTNNMMNDSYKEYIFEKNFEKWAIEHGKRYVNTDEDKPHTLLRLMRLEEKNEARSISNEFITMSMLFNELSEDTIMSLIENALEYCKKYGLPIAEIVESRNGNLYYGCDIDTLYFLIPNGLNHLYNRYMAWRYLQLGDVEAKKQCLTLTKDTPVNKNEFLRIVVGIQPTKIGIQPVYYDGLPRLLNICNSQLDMAAIQLTHIIARGDRYLENGRILYCKGCNQPFISMHGSRQYCDDCKANSTARVRVKRSKDKRVVRETMKNGGR